MLPMQHHVSLVHPAKYLLEDRSAHHVAVVLSRVEPTQRVFHVHWGKYLKGMMTTASRALRVNIPIHRALVV